MYPVPKEYLEAIHGRARTDRLEGRLTLEDGTQMALTDADWMSDSVVWDNQCVNGQELEFGSVYLGQVQLQLRTGMSRYRLYGAKLTLTYGLLLKNGSWYHLPMGVFTVAEAERTATAIRLICYDNVLLLNDAYNGVALQGTPYEILCQIAQACGVEMGQSAEEIAALCGNGTVRYQIDSSHGCDTWRDCAAAVAQVLGGFVTVDRAGRLVVRQFAPEPCLALDGGQRCEVSVSDFVSHYCGLTVAAGEDTYTSVAEGDTGLEMTLRDPPLWRVGLPENLQKQTDALFAVLNRIRYTPAELTMPGDPALDCGDRLALPDARFAAQETPQILVTHLTWQFRGLQKVRSVGKNPHLYGVASKQLAVLRRLQTETTGNRTVYYSFTNMDEVTVAEGRGEKTVATLQFATTADTTAMMLAQLLLNVTPKTETETVQAVDEAGEPLALTLTHDADVTLTVRYYLDSVLMGSFSPKQRLLRGGQIVTLFYPFTALKADRVYQLSIRLAAEGGTVKLDEQQMKATVTGQGLVSNDNWDGNVQVEELLPLLRVQGGVALPRLAEQQTMAQAAPAPMGFDAAVGCVTVQGGVWLAGLTEEPTADSSRP